MGRQASAFCHWKDRRAQVRALFEATEIILRGDIRAQSPRAAMSAIRARNGILSLAAGGQILTLDLGPQEAEKWAGILVKPPPSLGHKLGRAQSAKAFVIFAINDGALASAVHGLTTPIATEATWLIAEIHSAADFTYACRLALAYAPAPLWVIHEKGPAAVPKDGEIRANLRAQFYIDTKSSAVSATMTATLYRSH